MGNGEADVVHPTRRPVARMERVARNPGTPERLSTADASRNPLHARYGLISMAPRALTPTPPDQVGGRLSPASGRGSAQRSGRDGVSRAQRSMKQSGMMRCRPGIVPVSELGRHGSAVQRCAQPPHSKSRPSPCAPRCPALTPTPRSSRGQALSRKRERERAEIRARYTIASTTAGISAQAVTRMAWGSARARGTRMSSGSPVHRR